MGFCKSGSKTPSGLPTRNTLSGSDLTGVSKATKDAKKLAKRKQRINALAGIVDNADSKPALTTKGRIRATGGGVKLLADKSTVYKATLPDKLVSNVGGSLVELGNRATYPSELRAQIELDEKTAAKKETHYTDKHGSEHHKVRRPLTLNNQNLIIK